MGKTSRNKGNAFERKIVKMFSDAYDVKLRRTPLSGGWAQDYSGAAGDVVCVEDGAEFPYCIECKCSEGWRLESLFTDNHAWFDNWWQQMLDECPEGKVPLLVFSRNRTPTFVALRWAHTLSNCTIGCGFDTNYLSLSIDGIEVIIILLEDFLEWDSRN